MTATEVKKSIALNRCRMFWRDLKKFLTEPDFPHVYECEWLMEGLLERQLAISEAEMLCESILSRKWEMTLVNYYSIVLGSHWNYDVLHGRRPHPNDQVDMDRAVVAMARADLFITERSLAALCSRAKISTVSILAVYPVQDTDGILDFLRERLS